MAEKTFSVKTGIGKARHVISLHDGVKTHKDNSPLFIESALIKMGFSIEECPYTPIPKEFESFPIVKAIRRAEKEAGCIYVNPCPMDPGA